MPSTSPDSGQVEETTSPEPEPVAVVAEETPIPVPQPDSTAPATPSDSKSVQVEVIVIPDSQSESNAPSTPLDSEPVPSLDPEPVAVVAVEETPIPDSQRDSTAPATPPDFESVQVEVIIIPDSQPAVSVPINPGDDIQAMVDNHPAGTAFLIKSGVHRFQRVIPKNGNTFIGARGALLTGAKRLTEFSREGSYWVVTGQTQQGQVHGQCDRNLKNADGSRYTGCRYPEDLFFNDVALMQVETLTEVGPGKWFFDYDADKIYFYDHPSGHKVETSITRTAFAGSATDVTIRGLIIEKYANPAQMGAIGDQRPGDGWIIEDCEVRWNHGAGIRLASQGRARRNVVHHNGQMGLGGGGRR